MQNGLIYLLTSTFDLLTPKAYHKVIYTKFEHFGIIRF